MSKPVEAITRRDVILGTGAVTAGLGVAGLAGPALAAEQKWDHEADIVVVGSGVGGCTAALTAHSQGDSVLVLEKAPFVGGTSRKSAGVLWIPNNFTLRAKGIDDRKDQCLQYLARYSYPERYVASAPNLGLEEREYALLEAFYDNASAAVDHLRGMGALKLAEWRMFGLDRPATDYLDQVPENKVPTGRPVGPLRPDGSMGLGVDLMAQLEAALRQLKVPLLVEHAAQRIIMDDTGRAIGVEAQHGGAAVAVRARKAVIFASGGFIHNVDFSDTYLRQRLYGSCAMPSATGDFVRMATAVGARLGNMTGAWRMQVVLDEALRSRVLAQGVYFPPGDSMLQVNRYGRRAVNEKRNYNDRTAVHAYFDPTLATYPNELMFMIYDQRTAEGFAGAYPLPADSPTGERYVLKADTLDGLAKVLAAKLADVATRTGGFTLDPSFVTNLKASIERFNGFARAGKDDDFGRGGPGYDREWQLVFSPMRPDSKYASAKAPNVTMYPLSESGPYYAVILAAGCLDTCGGPLIDARARILDSQDRPIPGLHGAGNCIASASRFAYWGAGHTLAQSLTFGYIAARAAHGEGPGKA